MGGRLTVLASGSQGNGYILSDGNDKLIIECGVPVKKCLDKLGFDVSGVCACIVSHHDSDHAKYIKQYQTYFPVLSTPTVAERFNGVAAMIPLRKYTLGGFKVIPLQVPHGDKECYSYLITHPAIGNLLFITDAERFPYQLQGINTLMIEANYSDDIRVDAMLNGAELRAQSRNHMELGETINTINRLKGPDLQSVVLLHLSQGLSDAEGFKKRIFNECGVKAEVAEKGSVYSLQKQDF